MKAEEHTAQRNLTLPVEHRSPWILPAFLLFSLVAHLASFVVFQVVYPQHVTIPPPSPLVAILDAANPDHQPLLRWIAAEDPALVATTSHAQPPVNATAEYRPSFAVSRTPPRIPPPNMEAAQYPPVQDLPALLRSVRPEEAVPSPPPADSPSRWTFSGALDQRPIAEAPIIRIHPSNAIEPVQFLIGVSATGEVRYRFRHQSCGNEAVDRDAEAQLTRIRFAPAEAEITWGFATLTWGANVFSTSESTASDEARKP